MILSAPMSEEVVVPGSEAVEKAGEQERLRMIERILFGACGALLLGGFVLPWFTAGALLSFSGLGLVFAGGDVVGMLAGANRSSPCRCSACFSPAGRFRGTAPRAGWRSVGPAFSSFSVSFCSSASF